MIRNILLSIILIFFGCESSKTVDIRSITPRKYIKAVNERAFELDRSAKLAWIYTSDGHYATEIDSTGYLNNTLFPGGWMFSYLRKMSGHFYLTEFLVEQDGDIKMINELKPIYDPVLNTRFIGDSIVIPEIGWMDIDSAVSVAMDSGGRELISGYSGWTITAGLTRQYPKWNRLAWSFNFGQGWTITSISLDAQTGEIIAQE